MTQIFHVRRAAVADKQTIIGMIDEAAAWLGTKNTLQWQRPWPTRKARDERVNRGLRGGSTWLVEDDDGWPVATVTSRAHGNQNLWSIAEQREPAVYLSRLVVVRRHAGEGIGAALVDWAGMRALTAWQARWIRIDVWTDNTALHKYYENIGFNYLRTCPVDRRKYPSGALFQKSTADMNVAAAARFKEVPSVPVTAAMIPVPQP